MTDSNLPKNWNSAPLEDLIIFKLGGDWGKAPDFDDPDYVNVRCIRASELRDWDNRKGNTAALRRVKKTSLDSRRLESGDILVEISGGGPDQPVGRTVLIDKSVLSQNPETPKICTNFFRLIRPSIELNSTYLNNYLQHFYETGDIVSYQAGSNNLRNLKFNDYLTISMPVAPINEQYRIVTKIEELFSELDKGIESLKTALEQLKVYRQAVLNHAFEGRLTAQWREENKGKLEAADQLLVRIHKEREACYQEYLEKWKASVQAWEKNGKLGKKPSKPRVVKTLPEFSTKDLEELPSLPEGWAWVKVDKICNHDQNAIKAGPFGSALKKEFYTSSGYKIYGQEQVISGNSSYGDYFVSKEKYLELKSCAIKPFDILISLVGTVGKVLVLPVFVNEVVAFTDHAASRSWFFSA